MSLQGSLETFALPDVLVLLSSTKKDGELRVVGGRIDGKVWLEKGQVVHSQIGGEERKAVDAVFELLRLESGTFNFEAESKPPRRSEAQMIDLVLADAQVRLGEWQEIAKVVPHLDAVVDMAAAAPGPEVTLTADQWSLLRTVAGGCSVSALMAKLGKGEFDTCKVVKELVDGKLASIDLTAKPAAKADVPKADDKPAAKAADVDAPAATAAKPAEAVDKPKPKGDDELDRLAQMAAAKDDAPARPKVRTTTAPEGLPAQAVRATTPGAPAGNGSSSANGNGAAHAANPNGNGAAKPAAQPEEAKALVAQLAAIGGEDENAIAEKVAKHVAEGGELPEVVDGDEPINRGLLLKFLSSVRN